MRRTTFVVLGLLIALAGWQAGKPRASQRIDGVVIVTLDTVRADRLSPYGFMDVRMPTLERLASEGVLFEQAFSVVPLTLPAHTSMFTGLLPPAHGVRDNADQPLSADHKTLAEFLKPRGFKTGAFVSSVVLHPDRGLSRGFDIYGDVPDRPGTLSRQRPGNETIDEALTWLEAVGGSSFLLWAHLYDAHAPYDPPEPYRHAHSDPYVGELLFADAQLGRVVDALDRLHLSDRTLVIVVGDHGESLGDHGEVTHGQTLYEGALKVPLIIRGPGISPRRTMSVASLTDLTPTVLDVLGLPGITADGVSLSRVLAGEELDRAIYAESMYPERFGKSPLRALRDDRFKLIDGGSPELFDLVSDPFEQRNIVADRPTVARAMQAQIALLAPAADRQRPLQAVPREVHERLMALGYR